MFKPLTDAELEGLLADLESDRVERTRAWAGDAEFDVQPTLVKAIIRRAP